MCKGSAQIILNRSVKITTSKSINMAENNFGQFCENNDQ